MDLGDPFELLKFHYFLTLTLVNLGRISEALEVLDRVREMARRNGDVYWSARVPNCLGWIHRELQDFDSAMAFDAEGAEAARLLRVGDEEVNSVINLAFDLHTGDKQGTDSALDSAQSLLLEMRLQAARAEQTLSRREAVCLMQKASRRRARKYYIVAAHTLLARIAMLEGDDDATEAELTAAIGILREFPAPLAAWRTFSTLGRLRAQRGAIDDARAAFREAASIISYIAGHVRDDRLRCIFLNSPAVREALAFE